MINELKIVKDNTKKSYLVYTFLKYSNTQHGTLKKDLINDYYKRDNHYPKTRQETLYLLDKYRKITVAQTVVSEESSFAQSGGQDRGGNIFSDGNNQDYKTKFWENKICFNYNKKNYPAYVCPNTKKYRQ